MPSRTKPLQRARRNNQNGVSVHSIWSPDVKVTAVASSTTPVARTVAGRPPLRPGGLRGGRPAKYSLRMPQSLLESTK